jgi:hypothetical protein
MLCGCQLLRNTATTRRTLLPAAGCSWLPLLSSAASAGGLRSCCRSSWLSSLSSTRSPATVASNLLTPLFYLASCSPNGRLPTCTPRRDQSLVSTASLRMCLHFCWRQCPAIKSMQATTSLATLALQRSTQLLICQVAIVYLYVQDVCIVHSVVLPCQHAVCVQHSIDRCPPLQSCFVSSSANS